MRFGPLVVAGTLALCAAAPGCSKTEPVVGGEFENGRFIYYCTGTANPRCNDDSGFSDGFPAVALGAQFGVAFTTRGSDLAAEAGSWVAASAPDRIRQLTAAGVYGGGGLDTFEATLAGPTALLGSVQHDSTTVGDLIHVAVEPVETVQVLYYRAGSTIPDGSLNLSGQISIGGVDIGVSTGLDLGVDTQTLDAARVIVRSAGGALLAGYFPCVWTSSAPTVVEIVSAPTDDRVTLRRKAAGTADIRVEFGAWSLTFPMTVGAP